MTSPTAGPFARPQGLRSDVAASRLAAEGPNVVAQRRRVPWWLRVAAQLRDPLILVLIGAAGLTLATGDFSDAAVILVVIVVNTAVGVGQEARADRAVAALSELAAPAARVVRDGTEREIAAADVVTGDLLVLAEGDIVPADADVIESASLLVDESSLTGESVPVSKEAGAPRDAVTASSATASPGTVSPDTVSAGTVSAGTVVVRGRGHAVVTATGAASAMGQIASMLSGGPRLTPLQRRLARVGRVLAVGATILCALVFGIGIAQGEPVELMIVTAISLVVAAVPESLPAVTTLSLALGARRMAARNAIVRRLPAVETLGSVTVLATDKTGTLTEGRMAVREVWMPSGEASVTGRGYSPEGAVSRGGEVLSPESAPDVAAVLTAAMLCNDATLVPPDQQTPEWAAVGDPTEAALLAAASRLGLDRAVVASEWPRMAEVPFESARKTMITAHRSRHGGFRVLCKGAPEALLTPALLETDPGTLERAVRKAHDLAGAGMRVIAVAAGDRTTLSADPSQLEQSLTEQRLRLLGLIAIADPLRSDAAATIHACRAAGIAPVLITGDHPATARSVAAELGFIDDGGLVVDGRQLAAAQAAADGHLAGEGPQAGDGHLAGEGPQAGDAHRPGGETLARARVFARTTPEQKLGLVRELQKAGQIVAMTGDGVNDGPALRRADIGVAMGRRGTEVARQAADLVLANDDLATVVAAVEEGRRIYANVRRFLLYALSGGAAEIIIMLAGPALGMALPLLPAQILWINLMTHGLPGVALGAEPVAPSIMARPPRPPDESIIGAGLWQSVVAIAIVISAVSLGVGTWAHTTGRAWQSIIYLVLGATQLGVAMGVRARTFTRENPFLPLAVAGAFGLLVLGLYLPVLQNLLGTQPLPATDLLVACVLPLAGYAAARLDRLKRFGRERR
ncbi:MAG: cation-translocating P-type ATPase [Micromonosporaceae bacterium]